MELASSTRYAMYPDVARRGLFGRPCLPCEYVHFEVSVNESQSRIVVENEHFVTLSLGGLLGRSKFYVSKIYHALRANETSSVQCSLTVDASHHYSILPRQRSYSLRASFPWSSSDTTIYSRIRSRTL